MMKAPDRTAFLSKGLRLDVATLCRSAPRTRGELAGELGRSPGSLTAHDTMLRRGALVSAGTRPAGGPRPGGELLAFNPEWEDDLSAALARRSPGGLTAGSDVVLVATSATARACAVIEHHRDVGWGAPLQGEQMGLLLSPRDPQDEASALRLVGALADAGVQAIRIRVTELLPVDDLRTWATRVARPAPPELPRDVS